LITAKQRHKSEVYFEARWDMPWSLNFRITMGIAFYDPISDFAHGLVLLDRRVIMSYDPIGIRLVWEHLQES
jgi:hypothetical protein